SFLAGTVVTSIEDTSKLQTPKKNPYETLWLNVRFQVSSSSHLFSLLQAVVYQRLQPVFFEPPRLYPVLATQSMASSGLPVVDPRFPGPFCFGVSVCIIAHCLPVSPSSAVRSPPRIGWMSETPP
ncbi:MAG: hypothetical protein JRN56_05680, partial [Nitrososphaerota archaeon]|nr:hypothetical protein [Nitrososphaerota archaeon]